MKYRVIKYLFVDTWLYKVQYLNKFLFWDNWKDTGFVTYDEKISYKYIDSKINPQEYILAEYKVN